MYKNATQTHLAATVLTVLGLLGPNLPAQTSGWRSVGNSSIDLSLAGLATGPVNRVWYSASGSLFIHTTSGRVFSTTDKETWRAANRRSRRIRHLSRHPARVRRPVAQRPGFELVIYAVGKFAYSSDNGGVSWDNLTRSTANSIVGGVPIWPFLQR